ncbi:hypothetical protein SAMN05216223_11048 [Actinacidiphila yanglinensis]|uniref:Uncharacterized protein n=1 Tax=Actinacidiphila yanglinensis TaxID=310779 RepID=A0A1H6CU75_9ACTN|nr:hypothetical protein SAMN05216223_11048 [Actinacidiphila yanglinensis]
MTIAIGDYWFYSALRDGGRGDVERRELLPAATADPHDPGRWMHATAARDGQHRLAAGIEYLFGRRPALRRMRFPKDAAIIVDGTLVNRDHTIAEQAKIYGYSTSHQIVIAADTHFVVGIGGPQPGNRNDCNIADGRYSANVGDSARWALRIAPFCLGGDVA